MSLDAVDGLQVGFTLVVGLNVQDQALVLQVGLVVGVAKVQNLRFKG